MRTYYFTESSSVVSRHIEHSVCALLFLRALALSLVSFILYCAFLFLYFDISSSFFEKKIFNKVRHSLEGYIEMNKRTEEKQKQQKLINSMIFWCIMCVLTARRRYVHSYRVVLLLIHDDLFSRQAARKSIHTLLVHAYTHRGNWLVFFFYKKNENKSDVM